MCAEKVLESGNYSYDRKILCALLFVLLTNIECVCVTKIQNESTYVR